MIRQKTSPTLEEVPCRVQATASLLRSVKTKPKIKLDQYVQLRPHFQAKFGEATVEVLSPQGKLVQIELLTGTLPAQGTLCQEHAVSTPVEIFDEFQAFWSQYWQRESFEEQFEDTTWNDLHELIDAGPLPHVPMIDMGLDNPANWAKAIHTLSEGKAHGIDGWQYEELRLLPFKCIADLCSIF